MPATIDQVQEIIRLQNELKEVKRKEMALRNEIIKSYRFDSAEGVQHRMVEDYDVSITLKLNRSIDTDALDTMWHDLTDAEKACFEFVPKLDTKAYKALMATGEPNRLYNIVTEKPGQASLSVKM
jgi:hypothetical protein